MKPHTALNISRLLIAAVLGINLQCAIAFIFWPENYAPGFEVSGVVGNAVVRAMGILFVMWNVPYAFALAHPLRRSISLIEACIMQAVGVVGESLLWLTLPSGYAQLAASTLRFMVFDGLGLLALLIAFWISRSSALPAPAQTA